MYVSRSIAVRDSDMKLNRSITLVIHFVLDELLPPIIRDNRFFMSLLLRLGLGKSFGWFRDFKDLAPTMTDEDFRNYYQETEAAHIERETDLNNACIKAILASACGERVLDIACGRGFLTKKLASQFSVTGADFKIDPSLAIDHPEIDWESVNIEQLPYENAEFDTVICAHTLEHVPNIHQAIAELRRVTKKRLIIVLPKQRPYLYTFDLHIHFFPYRWQVELLMKQKNTPPAGSCQIMGGDWLYIEG